MNVPFQFPALLDLQSAATNREEAGGKGWQLGLLARYGLPVPDAFVIPASICRMVLQNAGIYSRIAELADGQNFDQTLLQCRSDIVATLLPDALVRQVQQELMQRGWTDRALAVRSSATTEDSKQTSFAGIYLSRLNVHGVDAVIGAVLEVWASLWTPQAAAYRARFGVSDAEVAMAVVIMPLLPAVSAGIAFSCDPRTGRDDQIILHAHWGLGEALVDGKVDGDEYRFQEDVYSTTLSLIDRRIGSKARSTVCREDGGTQTVATANEDAVRPVLDDAQALGLADLVRHAAFALDFGRPFYDIEWVWDGAQFWIVQARPVTAMARNTYPEIADQPTIWSNGNTRDVVPLPLSALDWCSTRRMVNELLEAGYRYAKYPLLPGAQRAALHNGRLYLNLSLMMWEAWDGFGVAPKIINEMAGGQQSEIRVPVSGVRDKLARIPRFIRYAHGVLPIRSKAQGIADRMRALARTWKSAALPDDNADCYALLLSRTHTLRNQPELSLLQGSAGASLSMLIEKLDKHLPGSAYSLTASLLAGGEPSVTAQQGYELMKMAEVATADPALREWLTSAERSDEDWRKLPEQHAFRKLFAAFLDNYGHRGVYETYWRQKCWNDAPGYLLDSIAGLIGTNSEVMRARQQEARDNAWRTLRGTLPWHARIGLKHLVDTASRDCSQRELARTTFTALADACRPLLLHIGKKLVSAGALRQADHVFELTLSEIGLALHGKTPAHGILARVADRLAMRAHWDMHHAADIIHEGGAPAAAAVPKSLETESDIRHGVAVGSGVVRGVAKVIRNPSEGTKLQQGEILVAPSTDPAWTPLFLKAGGLAMETGGYLSHGAIVAREFALPAVVNLPGLLGWVRDGDILEVDGGTGRVRLFRGQPDETTVEP